jgi:hypothetical protein
MALSPRALDRACDERARPGVVISLLPGPAATAHEVPAGFENRIIEQQPLSSMLTGRERAHRPCCGEFPNR